MSSSSNAIQDSKQSILQLSDSFNQGMKTLLQKEGLSAEDQECFAKTAKIVSQVFERFLSTAKEVGELEQNARNNQLDALRHTTELMLEVKEKEINLAHEDLNNLREQAEFLNLAFEQTIAAEQKLLPFNREETDLKRPHPQFTGRKTQLSKIKSELLAKSRVVLYGPPGVGKTETALAFANENIKNYSVVWTIDSATSIQREKSYRELADALRLPILEDDTPDKIQKRVHRKLESLEKPWLLLFDNLDEKVPFPARGGQVLITTRNRSNFPHEEHIEVPKMSKEESVELFVKITKEKESEKMLQLAEKLGYYPILLQNVANHIRMNAGLTIAQYFKQMSKIDLENLNEQERYQKVFETVLDKTIQELPKAALDWLKICAHLSPEGIPKSFIEKWLELEKRDEDAQTILNVLANRGIIQFDIRTNSFSIHRLYQEYFKGENGYCQAGTLIAELAKKRKKLDSISDYKENPNDLLLLVKHAIYIQSNWEAFAKLDEDVRAKIQELGEIEKAYFEELFGDYFFKQGLYSKAIEKHKKALGIKEKVLGKEHPELAENLNSIGMCLYSQGKHTEAIQMYQKALVIEEKILGKTHLSIATRKNNIASCLSAQGKYPAAIEKHQEALGILEKRLDKDDPIIGLCLNNLGADWHALGMNETAIDKWEKALEITEKALGKEHPNVAIILNNIGACFHTQRKNEEALKKHKKALEITEKALGKEHPEVAKILNNIGGCLLAQEKNVEAMKIHEKALKIREKILGEEHFYIAESLNSIGSCLSRQNRFDEALKKHEKALKIREKVFGEEHPEVANSLNNIGVCLHALKKNAEAKEAFEKSLSICRKTFGNEHPHTKATERNIQKCKKAEEGCLVM